MAPEPEIIAQFGRLSRKLRERRRHGRTLRRYAGHSRNVPDVIQQAQITKAYGMLMPVSGAPWGRLVVRSVLDRLEVSGLIDPAGDFADDVWGLWQANLMDSESKLGHNGALTTGRAFAIVWPDPDTDEPRVNLNPSDTVAVEFAHGDRRKRLGALKMWDEDAKSLATLYRPDGIYKFETTPNATADSFLLDLDGADGRHWRRRDVDGEEWPIPNPFGVVPVVELGVNRELNTGPYPAAAGEFEHCLGLLDRIDLLTFLGLVVAFWMGFPLRGILGAKILRDDTGKPLPPFTVGADQVVQIEDPNARPLEFAAADRKNLSVLEELAQLAYITSTPAHYFPMSSGLSNISADAIRALEGALHAKLADHKAFLGEGWLEVNRLLGLMRHADQGGEALLSPRARIVWKDVQSRSLAEQSDAAVKVRGLLPDVMIAERYLGLTQDDVALMETLKASEALNAVIAGAAAPDGAGAGEPAPTVVPSGAR